ncbi:unnamed protein product [Caenorhabditis sp. 36 PRJEB53466]|nr:unnamed protein product [Caenorhabditis sp. 36 PRJEB53466]
MSFLARGLSNLIGIVVPIVHTFKILKKPTNKKLIQSTQYWAVYGSLLVIDWLLNTFFISCLIPFYDFFILTFTVLMAIPQVGFATVLYTKFLAPFLRKYERRIDRLSGKIVDKMWERLPLMVITLPAVLASMVTAIADAPPVPYSALEIEEDVPDASETIGNVRKLPRFQRNAINRSVEVQSDDSDADQYEPCLPGTMEIKREPLEEEEQLAELPVRPKMLKSPKVAGMLTRRRLRSQSVL